MPHVLDKGKVIVTLSAQEVRQAIEHAAWCAAVDNDPSITVEESVQVVPIPNGYRVTYTKVAPKNGKKK